MNDINQYSINTIRMLSFDAINKSNSGHPGLPLGAATMAYTLWAKHLRHNPKNPNWVDRDRFVLSAGHGSMLIYSLLHLFNYGLSIDDIKNFRQLDSKTPGHPEFGHTIGVEATTGPLGQGFANAVGMAMAERYLANTFNTAKHTIIDHYTYALSGDGCLMEGISNEAASFAGAMGLSKLIVLYDSNKITIEGSTDLSFTEDVNKRFEALGWQVQTVEDGNDIAAISQAIENAKKETEKPSLIKVKTIIGYGCVKKQGTPSVHGEPCGKDSRSSTIEYLGWNHTEEFIVPDEVKSHMENICTELADKENSWNLLMDDYQKSNPELYSKLTKWLNNNTQYNLYEIPDILANSEKKMATRATSGEIINNIFNTVDNLFGGSADLSPSTKTNLKAAKSFSKADQSGANIHFGVREHAMAAICNGIALHGGLRPYNSTFMVFSDYMKPSIRLSAMMKLPVLYIFTHDSIGVGEDGPTHQPIEQLSALRAIPNLTVIRPADYKETLSAWNYSVNNLTGPTALILTRQNLPCIETTGKDAEKGAYIVFDSENPQAILISNGSELSIAVSAHKELAAKGISTRVVSMPSWEIFEKQSPEYKNKILPANNRNRVVIEAASSFGWDKYLGFEGKAICINDFGASAPAELLYQKYGFTVENIIKNVEELLENK